MILGIGLDLCEISRMERLLLDGRFLSRFFSEEEQAYIAGKKQSAGQTIAGIFAAKEALAKALGKGLGGGALKDVCVLHNDQGAPYYSLHGDWKHQAEQMGISCLYLSISHDGGVAAAVCIAEKT